MIPNFYISFVKNRVLGPFFYAFTCSNSFFIYLLVRIIYIMLYLNKGQVNTLVLNINNNSRNTFTSYDLIFTHIMSKQVKSYSVDVDDPAVFWENIRYCTITLDFATDDLIYEGQYQLNIYGQPDNILVYTGMVVLDGVYETEPFTTYISPNESNENYIYIQD